MAQAVQHIRCHVQPDGTLAGDEPDLSGEELLRLFDGMLTVRVMDTRLLNMQRQGRIGFYGTARGEEASVIGTAAAFRDDDWLFPALRQGGALVYRGFSVAKFVAQCIGNSMDNLKGRQMPVMYSMRTSTGITLLDGTYCFVAALSPKSAEGFPDFDKKLMVFVRADVVTVGR